MKTFYLPPSKSLLARRLVTHTLVYNVLPDMGQLGEVSLPEDIDFLYKSLESYLKGEKVISVGESGTAMRFMTALLPFTIKDEVVLNGLGRQHGRPIAPLVDALRLMGANIEYIEKDGYPPLRVSKSQLTNTCTVLDASESSQYLSALLLLAPLFEEGGFYIKLKAGLASRPYAEMTVEVLKEYGFCWEEKRNAFVLNFSEPLIESSKWFIESDWSAASYAYELCLALGDDTRILLPNLRLQSLQGDGKYLPTIFKKLGVITEPCDRGVYLNYIPNEEIVEFLELDCGDCPDIVPTLVASCIIKSISFQFKSVHHLRIKESDRLAVLQRECRKVGVELSLDENEISWNGVQSVIEKQELSLDPEGDHRMAMALFILFDFYVKGGCMLNSPNVVAKSFPRYWNNLSIFGYNLSEI